MAVKYAVGSGNWSDSSKWNGGTLPLAGDTVYTNNNAIIVDTDVSLGGYGIDYDVGPDECVVGGYYTIKTVGTTNWVAMGAAGNVAGTRFICLAAGTGSGVGTTKGTIINGSLASPAITAGGQVVLGANVTLRADVENTGTGGGAAVLSYAASAPAESWWYGTTWGGSGGTSRPGIVNSGSGTLNATGIFYGGTSSGCVGLICSGTGRTRITGSAYARNANAINISGLGIIELAMTDCVGSNVVTTTHGINITSSATITGSVSNCMGGSQLDSRGVYAAAGIPSINITGIATGGSQNNANGISTGTNASIIFSGIVIGGAGASGASNLSTGGTLYVTRAVGAISGNQPGLACTQNTALAKFKELEFGAQGAPPTSGFCFLEYDAINGNSVTIRQSSGGPFKVFVDAVSIPSAVPANADVRNGVSYNFGNNAGTCHVPSATSVAAGVPVDNTVGTAVLTPAAVQAIVGAIVADAIDS